MRTITERYFQAMENQLAEARLNHENLTDQYRVSILICKKAMAKLKSYVSSYAFENLEEEIHFFKEVKPLFYSKYIYYINVYNFLMQKPAGGEEIYRNYIQVHLANLAHFFDSNKAFYQYYRSGSHQMDAAYFSRGGFDVQMELEDFEEDEQYSTSHDYKLSKLIANQKFQDFLRRESEQLQSQDMIEMNGRTVFPFAHPAWTAGQTDAIELIYSLKASGAVNNGNIEIAAIIEIFEFVFQYELRDAYHKFADITRRKKVVPVFLNRLADGLIKWIDDKMA